MSWKVPWWAILPPFMTMIWRKMVILGQFSQRRPAGTTQISLCKLRGPKDTTVVHQRKTGWVILTVNLGSIVAWRISSEVPLTVPWNVTPHKCRHTNWTSVPKETLIPKKKLLISFNLISCFWLKLYYKVKQKYLRKFIICSPGQPQSRLTISTQVPGSNRSWIQLSSFIWT